MEHPSIIMPPRHSKDCHFSIEKYFKNKIFLNARCTTALFSWIITVTHSSVLTRDQRSFILPSYWTYWLINNEPLLTCCIISIISPFMKEPISCSVITQALMYHQVTNFCYASTFSLNPISKSYLSQASFPWVATYIRG